MNNDHFSKNGKDYQILVRKAIKASNKPSIFKYFQPKAYLEGKINLFNCNHEVFLTKDSLHVCAICGFSFLEDSKIPHSIEFTSYNEGAKQFIKSLLTLISYHYIDKEEIDLLKIISQLEPNIKQILTTLSKRSIPSSTSSVSSNDSETIANLLKDFQYNPSKTEEILKEYENLPRSSEPSKLSLN